MVSVASNPSKFGRVEFGGKARIGGGDGKED